MRPVWGSVECLAALPHGGSGMCRQGGRWDQADAILHTQEHGAMQHEACWEDSFPGFFNKKKKSN